MSVTLTVPAEYGYVIMTAVSTFFVNIYHGVLTGQARKKSGITYPVSYADKALADKDPNAYAFNCAQRAHANFTENHTNVLTAILISGIKFPIASATLGAAWAVSRIVYAKMYGRSGPAARRLGAMGHYLTSLPLFIMAGYTGYSLTK